MALVNICRACLSPEDRVLLINWYQHVDTSENVLSYKECFCKCTQINLSLKDDPNESDENRMQYLCFDCAQKLKDAYEFIEKAKRSDIELHCIQVEKVKVEGIVNDFEWVPVEVDELKSNKLSEVADKDCMQDIKDIHEWNERCMDDNGPAISDDNEQEDNLNKNVFNKLDGHCNDDEVMATAKEHQRSADVNLKNVKKRAKVKTKCKPSKKTHKTVDKFVNCKECGKTITRKSFGKHMHRHKPKTFLCQTCPKTFSDASGLKNHELTHEEHRKTYECEICNQTFLSRYSYKRHLENHESNRKPMYHCSQCDKSFLTKGGLRLHDLHHKGATIICNICQKRYVQQSDLAAHLRTHSGEHPFLCNICGKSFICKRNLSRHQQHHPGYFNYTCLTCGEKFSKYDKYYTHRMQHTGLPFKCGTCEKQFPDTYKIKRHIRGVHKVEQDKEVEQLIVRINITKEYRGRIVEVLKNPEDEITD